MDRQAPQVGKPSAETYRKRSVSSPSKYQLALGMRPEEEARIKDIDSLQQWEYRIRGLLCYESLDMLNKCNQQQVKYEI